ncbi:unnamed protein product [Lactuca saligna]|uniref:beta-galactosidase n=1 Tax=Lactuca saligna TaxID=75948 RepID=A0AA36ENC2_LACSI|nr:unnamed protein product [Lactuca saligna]
MGRLSTKLATLAHLIYQRSRLISFSRNEILKKCLNLPVFEIDGETCLGVVEVVTTSQKVNLRDELEKICKALQGDKSYWYQQFIPMLPCILSADDEQSKSRLQVFIWALLAVRSQFGMLDDGARIHVIPHLFREAVDCGFRWLCDFQVSDEVKYLRNSRAEQTKQVAEFHVRMNEIISSDLNQRRAFEDDIHSSLSSILASYDSIGASFPHSHVSEEVAAICDAKLKSSDIQAVVLFIYFPHSHVRVVVEVMVKQNNVFPNKEMQWQQKVVKVFPRPAVSLCPQVHCETSKYNMKLREDRGFSFEELKVNPDMVLQLENVGLSFTGKGESSQQLLRISRSYRVHQAAATAYGALCAVLCSLLIGSNGRQNHVILGNLVDRFIGWALSLFSNINVGDGIVELAAEGLHEFLNVAEGLNADYFFGSSLAESSTYADLKVEVILDKSMKINNITDAKIEATLFDINTNEGSNLLSTNVASLELQQPPHFPLGFHGYQLEGKLKNPKLWSAEQLNLYTLVVTLKDASGNIIDCELCLSRQGGGYSRKIQMVANIGHMEDLLEGLEIAAKLLSKTSRQGLDELKISYFGMARSFEETRLKQKTWTRSVGVSWISREKRLRRDEDMSPEQGRKSGKVTVVEVVFVEGKWQYRRSVVGGDRKSPNIKGRMKRCLMKQRENEVL